MLKIDKFCWIPASSTVMFQVSQRVPSKVGLTSLRLNPIHVVIKQTTMKTSVEAAIEYLATLGLVDPMYANGILDGYRKAFEVKQKELEDWKAWSLLPDLRPESGKAEGFESRQGEVDALKAQPKEWEDFTGGEDGKYVNGIWEGSTKPLIANKFTDKYNAYQAYKDGYAVASESKQRGIDQLRKTLAFEHSENVRLTGEVDKLKQMVEELQELNNLLTRKQ